MNEFGPEAELDTLCPYCRKPSDRATAVGHSHGPTNGAAMLCIHCGEWAIFDASAPGGMRYPTIEEHIDIGFSENARRIRDAWQQMDAERRKPPTPTPEPDKPELGALAREWADIRESMLPEGEDDDDIKQLESLFYMGAISCYQIFNRARQSQSLKPIKEAKKEMDDFAARFLEDRERRKR